MSGGPGARREWRSALNSADPGARSPGRSTALAIAGTVVVVDQLSKAWAVSALADGQVVNLIGQLLRLRLVYNPGAAFSLGEQVTWLFTAVSLVVCVTLVMVLRGGISSMGWAVALGSLLGGAAGNLIDRLFRPPELGAGHVIDFIDYNGFFVGNVADIAIVGAAAVLAVLSVRNVPMRSPAWPGRDATRPDNPHE